MNHLGVDILDHGDDPGRYTVIWRSGLIQTCNENGLVICQRRCKRPSALVHDLSRETGIRVMATRNVPAFLDKISLYDG